LLQYAVRGDPLRESLQPHAASKIAIGASVQLSPAGYLVPSAALRGPVRLLPVTGCSSEWVGAFGYNSRELMLLTSPNSPSLLPYRRSSSSPSTKDIRRLASPKKFKLVSSVW
jgi:hypothetical protein